jgi:Holliday junction resolvasome RuvABC endonuclease subunit
VLLEGGWSNPVSFFIVILSNMSKTRVLGFDISSTTIGWCHLEVDTVKNTIEYKKMGYIKPSKKGTIMERIVETRHEVLELICKINPDEISVEDLIKFMPKSTATTVVVLTTFNRMICLLAHDFIHKQPELFNVMSIRHALKLNKDLPKKEDMPELVAKHLGITFPYEYDKKGKIKEVSRDMADGVAVALYHAFVLTGKVVRKVKKPKVKKK